MAERFKAIVVGSGAGGAAAAFGLAQTWGAGVAILEAGKHYISKDFTQLEREMVPAIYADGGTRATEDGTIGILQGECVGGSTVINDALAFRPPPEIFERWKPYGFSVTESELAPFVDEVEAAMKVERIPREMINRANYLLGLGAARLGLRGERLRHNSPKCVQCGFRHFGCAYGVKQSMDLSFVPMAVAAGAQLMPETRVSHIQSAGNGWLVFTDKGEYEADKLVLAGGITGTPTILLRSGIPAGEGLQFHIQTVAWGEFNEPVDGFNGIPMAYGVLEYGDVYGQQGPGFLIEGVAVQPASFALQTQAEGVEHQDFLLGYRRLAGALMLLRPQGRGRLTLTAGRPKIEHELTEHDRARTAQFFDRITEIYLAAGATRVALAHRKKRWTDAPPGLNAEDVKPGSLYFYTAHPFGGACRGTTVDGEGAVNGHKNLWVLDASSFPEAPGANPQITIASLALRGARRIAAGS